MLAGVHDATGGVDGFVSFEVDPTLAYDAEASTLRLRLGYETGTFHGFFAGADFEAIRFGWMGPTERAPGNGHYYRVLAPTFLIEYDNVQGNANHSHTVWRDYDGDFGRDLLREHRARRH